MKECQKPDSMLAELLYRFGEWRWQEAFQSLQSDVLLVTDADIGAALIKAYGPLNCSIADVDGYEKSVTETIQKLVILSRTGEWTKVKQARRSFPNLEVVSATYDLSRPSVTGGGYFEWQSSNSPVDGAKDPVLIITTPGSDVEYFTEVLKQNHLADAKEFLNRTAAQIATEQTDFSVLRFLLGINKKHGKDRLQLVVYTDVLMVLLDHSHMSMEHFVRLLDKTQTRVIYFSRRDKSMQASLLSQIDHELGRSFWATGHLSQPAIKDSVPEREELDEWLEKLLRAESVIEPKLAKLKKFKFLTLEELVESPDEVLDAVAVYLNKEAPSEPTVPVYERPYKKRPKLVETASRYRQALMDRLGLTLDQHGCYVSKLEFLGSKRN